MINKFIKVIVVILFISFLFLYVLSSTDYYYSEYKKQTELTSKEIERFEQDVKSGKEIDMDTYLKTDKKSYDNSVSKLGTKISSGIENFFSSGFKFLIRYVNENNK